MPRYIVKLGEYYLECLTVDEIYRAYCLRESIRGGWVVPTVEDGE